MVVIRELEFFEDEGMVCAFPFGLEGATCGTDLEDAVFMAVDWLKSTVEYQLMHGENPESGVFGNMPQHGGQVIAVAVECDLGHVDAALVNPTY